MVKLQNALLCVATFAGCRGAVNTTLPHAVTDADFAIEHVRVFDGTNSSEDQTVLVAGDRIVAVGTSRTIATPARAQRIDGTGKTLLPGLIDAHAHVIDADDARTALIFGVTTELDMMSIPTTTVPLSHDASDRARVVPAGYAATAPGGHGTEYGFIVPTLTRPDEAEAFVAARVADGSHHLKIIIEDGHEIGRPLPTLDAPTVTALVHAAHAHHMLAVAHVGSANDVATALAGGVDGLAHVPAETLDTATLAQIASRHIFVAPTLSVLASVCGTSGADLAADPRFAPFLLPDQARHLATPFPMKLRNLQCDAPAASVATRHAAHVVLLAGTDAPNAGTAHGVTVHGELARLVAAGLSPSEALTAATSAPAHAFGLVDVGKIRIGAIADLLLVDGDPTHDITATRAINSVWRAGHAVNREARRAEVVAAVKAEHDAQAAAPKTILGPIASFDDGTATARFGVLFVATDALRGGSSTGQWKVISPGADGTAHALSITGEVIASKMPYPFSGLTFSPAGLSRTPADLRAAHKLSFWTRGDGHTYVLLLLSTAGIPAMKSFVAPAAWTHIDIDLDAMGLDLSQVAGIGWASTTIGPFAFDLDQLELR